MTVPVYSALNRPHLKHCIQFCSYRKAEKVVGGHMTYEERLRDPKLRGGGTLKVAYGSLPISEQGL